MKKKWIALAAALGFAPPAWADNVAHCEALLMQTLPGDGDSGEAQIASYRPAVNFLGSLYDEEDSHMTEIDGFLIRAIMCRRNTVIPSESDYPILATGLPFILSQDFDSPDTDSLTVFWKDGALDYVYKGHPLSDDSQAVLETRLAEFTERGKTEGSKVEASEKMNADVEIEEAEAENVEVEDLELGAETTEITDVDIEDIDTEVVIELEDEAENISSGITYVDDAIEVIETETSLVLKNEEE